MKNLNLFFKIFIILFSSFFLFQCSQDVLEPVTGKHFSPRNKKFTYKDFLNETNLKDNHFINKYSISKLQNGVMSREVETEFLTDTTEIKRLQIENTEKITYTFKIYPLNESLNSKEYYNLVVEKNGNQLSYLLFFNKDKDNPLIGENPVEFSQLVYHSRSPYQGFIEVIEVTSLNCNGRLCHSSCDLCPECWTVTIKYIYQGDNGGFESGGGSIGGGSTSAGGTDSGSGGASSLSGTYIPNPYDGVTDVNSEILMLALQINSFINTLSPEQKAIAINQELGFYAFTHTFFQQFQLNNQTKSQFVQAIDNYLIFTNNLNSNITTNAMHNIKHWAFYNLLFNNENSLNTVKILNLKNFLNNQNIDWEIKEKIANLIYEKNNQETLNFVNSLISISINNQDQSNFNLLINSLIEIKNTFEIDSIELYNQQYDYISRMSESELEIYNNMLPNRKMWYLASAYKSSIKSLELFPDSQRNGKGDAFRHALWNTLSSLTIGYDLTQQLTTAHEEVPFTYQYQFKEKNMDLHNNSIGLTISNYSNLNNAVSNVISRFNSGYMVYLNNLDPNNLATHLSQQTPSNQ